MAGPQRPQIVLFGSSIVQQSFCNNGWGAALADIYARKADIVLRGYNGWNSRRAIKVLDQIFPKGLSDTTRIIFLSSPPVDEVKIRELSSYFSEFVRTNELCRIYSEACIKLCNEMGIKVIDLWKAFLKHDDWLTYFINDGIHLSGSGSKIVVEEMLKVLKEAEWKPSLHWKSMPTEFPEDSDYDLVNIDGKTTLNSSDWTFHREIQWD